MYVLSVVHKRLRVTIIESDEILISTRILQYHILIWRVNPKIRETEIA